MTFGEKMRALMQERGLSLRKLAAIVHYDAGYLSKVCNGLRVPSASLVHRLDEVLGAHGDLVALAQTTESRAGGSIDDRKPLKQHETGKGDDSETAPSLLDLLSLAWTVGRLDLSMDRRSLLRLAAAVSATPALGMADPIERLSQSLGRPMGISEDLVAQLEARCVGLHRLEFILPPGQLFQALLSHLNEITFLLESAPGERWRRRLARTAGESAVLGAWLAWDLGDVARCSALYRLVEVAAKESGDSVLRVCSAIYKSFATSAAGAHGASYRMLGQARTLVPERGDRATRAWLMGRQAEEAAALGDRSAKDLIEQASALLAVAHPQVERPWTRCLESPRMSHMRLTISTRLGDESGVHDEIGDLVMLTGDPAQKKTGRMLATIGLALARIGDVEEGVRFGEKAVEAVKVSQARYAMNRLSELGTVLQGDPSPRARELRAAIHATPQGLVSPRPSTPGKTPVRN